MKRKLVTLLMVAMVMAIGGCGANEDVSNPSESQSMESSVEVAVDATKESAETSVESVADETNVESEPVEVIVEPESTEVVEESAEASAEEVFVFNEEKGMEKINRLFEAHSELIDSGKMLEHYIQYDTEGLSGKTGELTQFVTADGNSYKTTGAIWATGVHYYNNYVNNGMEYYDFEDWLLEQPDNDTLANSIANMTKDNVSTNEVLLVEAIGVIAYMKSCEKVTPIEVIETNEYVVSDVISAYAMPLDCDGDTALTAVFDAEGNLLNICTPDDGSWNNYMTSFPDGDRGTGSAE